MYLCDQPEQFVYKNTPILALFLFHVFLHFIHNGIISPFEIRTIVLRCAYINFQFEIKSFIKHL